MRSESRSDEVKSAQTRRIAFHVRRDILSPVHKVKADIENFGGNCYP